MRSAYYDPKRGGETQKGYSIHLTFSFYFYDITNFFGCWDLLCNLAYERSDEDN